LVDDDLSSGTGAAALKDPTQKNNRDHVDIIIALGMAKEGFDWIWCEHALTVGYRSSLTEIVQIIGRATRDAPGKTRARFTNLIAEPDASEAGRDRGRERHLEGHRRQPADGAGAGAALRVQAEEPDRAARRPASTMARAAMTQTRQCRLQRGDGAVPDRDQGARRTPKSEEAQRICRRT
jgi:superfamily II DNA or RNA helicase